MKFSEWAVRLAVTPVGAAMDRICVRYLGHSPVSIVFARSEGVEYNPPLLLTTRGRRSGKPRTVVLPHFDVEEDDPGSAEGPRVGKRVAVVGSRGGMPKDPYWALNLRAHPQARIWLGRREIEVDVELAEGPLRERLWASITARSPVYVQYQERAASHREIPVFVLSARDGSVLIPE